MYINFKGINPGEHRLYLLLRPLHRREDGGEEEVVPVEGEEGPRQGPAEAGREADIVEISVIQSDGFTRGQRHPEPPSRERASATSTSSRVVC